MILTTTSDIVRVITSSAGTISVQADWADQTTTTFTPGRTNTTITTATTTTLVASPASSTQRQIKNMTIVNTDALVTNTITVQFFDGADAFVVFAFTLAPNKQIQFNGTAWSVFDSNTNSFINLVGIASEPSTPSAGNLLAYSKNISGKMILKVKGPSGLDTPLQDAFWQNNITMWNPTTVVAGVWLGTVGAGTGTFTTALPTSTNTYTAIKRARMANIITTTNQVIGQRNTELMYQLGGTAGQGGFFFYTRCGFDTWTNGARFFAGLATATTVISLDPSALNNTVGFCVDAADNGAISFLTRDTGFTKASTGFTITSNKGYDLYMFCAPNGTQVGWRIVDITTGTEASGTATLTLPVGTTMLTANVLASNAALTPVTSINLGINRIYVETDY